MEISTNTCDSYNLLEFFRVGFEYKESRYYYLIFYVKSDNKVYIPSPKVMKQNKLIF